MSRRAEQAEQTRQEILRSARRLFAEKGYARATVREVAEGAGVSAQTVYDSIGSKQALVARLNDLIDQEAGIGRIVAESMAADEPAVVARTQARITRAILEHCGDIVHALVTGAASEPELAAVLREGHRRHIGGATQVVRALHDRGALGEGADLDEAAATLAVVSDLQVALTMRETYGWSLDRIEDWIGGTSVRLLLGA